MMTVPITTPHFHSRVLGLLSSHLSNLQSPSYDASGTMATTPNTRPLVIPPLSKADSHLTPNEATSQLVGVTSKWIDLCSPDPLVADLSRQTLMLEVAYAAFCGIGYLLVPGPKLHHGGKHSEGIIYYARAIQDALSLGPYIQFHIWLRMVDNPELEVDAMGDLAPLARNEYLEPSDGFQPEIDAFGTWDAWDCIRKTCKYHTRLFVGENRPIPQSSTKPVAHVKSSSHYAKAASVAVCAVAMAFRTGASAHDRCHGIPQESKGIPGLVQGTSGADCQNDAPSNRAVDSTM